MRRLALLALVAGVLTPAYGSSAEPTDVRRCHLTSATDVTAGFGQKQVGQLNGGPIGDPLRPAATVVLRCTVHVGNNTHSGSVAAQAAAVGTGVAVFPPVAISYTLPHGVPVYVCSQLTVDGATRFWDAQTGRWVASPDVPCTVAERREVTVGVSDPQSQELLCNFASVTDPTGEGDVQAGAIEGGPVTATSTDPNAPSADPTASISIKCTVQVGATGATHAGPDAASATGSGTGAAFLPPTQISYVSPQGADVFLCSEVTINGVTSYWDDTNGAFSASTSVACSLAISQELDPDEGPIHETELLIDSIICPTLATVLPPEGDIVLPDPIGKFWDCPPYDSRARRSYRGDSGYVETTARQDSVWIVCASASGGTACL